MYARRQVSNAGAAGSKSRSRRRMRPAGRSGAGMGSGATFSVPRSRSPSITICGMAEIMSVACSISRVRLCELDRIAAVGTTSSTASRCSIA